jgi:hypothetical protein
MQIIIRREKEKQNPGCVIHYNKNVDGPDKNCLLLQMYLAWKTEG